MIALDRDGSLARHRAQRLLGPPRRVIRLSRRCCTRLHDPVRGAPVTSRRGVLGVPDRAHVPAGGRIDSISDGCGHRSSRTSSSSRWLRSSIAHARQSLADHFLRRFDRQTADVARYRRAVRRRFEEGDRMSERKVGSVTYQEVDEDYFKERGLRRHAGMWSLWALGVGAVISGEYYGWNFGLGTGGFGGLLIAAALMAVMYYGLVYSIAEMSPALPHTGGAYSFARSAMGPWGGFLTGLGREHGVRDHAGRRRRRDGPADAGDRRRACSTSTRQPRGGTACRSGGPSSTSSSSGSTSSGSRPRCGSP